MKIKILIALVFILASVTSAFTQTTEFTYQGSLVDNSAPANAGFDFELRLFSVEAGGAPIATIQRPGVLVTNGIFSASLDFGANFPGAARFLEIAVKPPGSANPPTVLAPRQPISSVPYAIRSLNSANTENVGSLLSATVASATQLVNNSTSANTPNALIRRDGSGNFSANIVNATQYNIGAIRILSADGINNIFAGKNTALVNTPVGSNNSFFGANAGDANTNGSSNSFFGMAAGGANTVGFNNVFIGAFTAATNTTGDANTLIGQFADVGSGDLRFATAIGSYSRVTTSNTIALGRPGGEDRVLVYGPLDLNTLGSAGSTALCRNASGYIASCSSSLRYKTDVRKFSGGLELVRKLQPITFNWKEGGMPDLGFGAEEVERIEPLLTTSNERGEIEGVKYAQISTVLVNAVGEQQAQIETQQRQIETQQAQIARLEQELDRQKTSIQQRRDEFEKQQKQLEELKQIICSAQSQAEVCRGKGAIK